MKSWLLDVWPVRWESLIVQGAFVNNRCGETRLSEGEQFRNPNDRFDFPGRRYERLVPKIMAVGFGHDAGIHWKDLTVRYVSFLDGHGTSNQFSGLTPASDPLLTFNF